MLPPKHDIKLTLPYCPSCFSNRTHDTPCEKAQYIKQLDYWIKNSAHTLFINEDLKLIDENATEQEKATNGKYTKYILMGNKCCNTDINLAAYEMTDMMSLEFSQYLKTSSQENLKKIPYGFIAAIASGYMAIVMKYPTLRELQWIIDPDNIIYPYADKIRKHEALIDIKQAYENIQPEEMQKIRIMKPLQTRLTQYSEENQIPLEILTDWNEMKTEKIKNRIHIWTNQLQDLDDTLTLFHPSVLHTTESILKHN